MAQKSEFFSGKYTKAPDVKVPVVAKIRVAASENLKTFSGEMKPTMVIYFTKGLKPLPLNSVNWDSIADIAGDDDSDHWGGVEIELYADKTEVNGQMKDCVRIRKPGTTGETPTRRKVTPPHDDLDDEIPFN